MKKIKNIVLLVIFCVFIIFVIACAVPIKKTISYNKFDISNYSSKEYVTLLCYGANSTDIQFVIEEFSGVSQCPRYIKNLKGNTPENFLKRQIDDNYSRVKFLFIGNFAEEIKELDEPYSFYVNEWYTVGAIKRDFFDFVWHPSYGFNVFEVDTMTLEQLL